MSGHSKWANIKHRKAASDATKGKVFSKLAREIMVAARIGGGDPNANISLRAIMQKARAVNMPSDNIERAIKKGTGELVGAAMEENMYEGFAPGGVSLVVQALTDNRNRTTAEIKHVFARFNSNLAAQGSVMRSFRRRAQFVIKANTVDEDKLLEVALDAGADDVERDGDTFQVLAEPALFAKVGQALTAAGIKVESSDITLIPDAAVPVTDPAQASQLLKLMEALEELDDVQNVYANFDMEDSVLEAASKG